MEQEIKAYSIEGIESVMRGLGQPRFRADQLFQWLYLHGVSDYGEMSNLPLSLRKSLGEEHPLKQTRIIDRQVSNDGTRKYLLEFEDGARVEAVAMPTYPDSGSEQAQYLEPTSCLPLPSKNNEKAPAESPSRPSLARGGNARHLLDISAESPSRPSPAVATDVHPTAFTVPEPLAAKRLTVCFSTQVGCAMGCAFCATGTEGFSRNLLPGEIVDQVFAVQKDFDSRVSNLVAMGQGEPFLNYDSTLAALRILNSPKGLAIGARHITVSTCGIIEGIKRLADEPEQFTLAVSLHSAEQAVRDRLMPKLAKEPLSQLKSALFDYQERTNRRITLEYAMIDGINDTPVALTALTDFCSGLLCHVNLLPINPIVQKGRSGNSATCLFLPSGEKAVHGWLASLEKARIPATLRNPRGADIAGACGQLTSLTPR